MNASSPITVRELRPRDRPGWRRLWEAYLAFYQAELAPPIVEATWTRLLDHRAPMRGFLASDTEGLLGLAHVVLLPTTWSQAPNAYLQHLFVDPASRRRGAGAALMQASIRFALEVGAPRLTWLTRQDNRDARALYDQVGQRTGFIQYTASGDRLGAKVAFAD